MFGALHFRGEADPQVRHMYKKGLLSRTHQVMWGWAYSKSHLFQSSGVARCPLGEEDNWKLVPCHIGFKSDNQNLERSPFSWCNSDITWFTCGLSRIAHIAAFWIELQLQMALQGSPVVGCIAIIIQMGSDLAMIDCEQDLPVLQLCSWHTSWICAKAPLDMTAIYPLSRSP